MIRKFFLFYILILSYSLESVEAYGLKNSYEVKIELNGSDKTSIEEGMRGALKTLMVKLTGSTEVAFSRELNNLYRNSEQYINQYKLNSSDEVIYATFFFEGNKIRNFLSDNQLPLWLSKENIVMTFIPCELKSSINLLDTADKEYCTVLKDNLTALSKKRIVELAYPILDFRDLNYLDSLSSVSYSTFMNMILKRYSLQNWIVCFIRDDFGVFLESSKCISSISDRASNLDRTFNSLINSINSKNSLIVNKNKRTNSKISIEGVSDYLTLKKVKEELRSQIIVTDLNLKSISGDTIEFDLSSYGSLEDIKNLLKIHSNFIQLEDPSDDRLIYRYLKI